MSKSLQDICREARDRQGMTNQDVADNSNVPLSSVQNFFASTSKTPTVNNLRQHMPGLWCFAGQVF